MRRADVAADVDAAAVGQPGVENGDVRRGGRDAAQRLGGGAGLTDHLDVVLGLEQVGDAAPDDLVVVEQEDPDRRCRRIASGQRDRPLQAGSLRVG